jgi:hypothetical protein
MHSPLIISKLYVLKNLYENQHHGLQGMQLLPDLILSFMAILSFEEVKFDDSPQCIIFTWCFAIWQAMARYG